MTEFNLHKNSEIHMSLLENELDKLGCKQLQSYFPILSLLSENPDTNIRLPSNNSIIKINNKVRTEEDTENDEYNQKYIKTIMTCDILNNTSKKVLTNDIFIKLIPILEPIQYAMGEFHSKDGTLNETAITTINKYNNTAYTEVFANYLLSLLVEKDQCPNFPIFYGTYSSIIEWFQYDFSEEWDGIQDYDFFKEQYNNGNIIYDFKKNKYDDILELYTIRDEIDLELEKIDLDEFNEDSQICEIEDGSTLDKQEDANDIAYWCKLKNYPIQIGFFEKLDYTIEEYIDEEGDLTPDEWKSILFQVIFALSLIQKRFNMIHNDLHTDNIMLSKTDCEYFHYVIGKQVFRVPTYGNVVKIIDFARATYELGDTIIFPSVFEDMGDAEGQYDIPSNNKWSRNSVKPNPSFYLARLSTTVYEYIEDDTELLNLMLDWSKLDNGKTMLFEEDSFELYCKIARECHNAIPSKQFNKDLFKEYKIKIKKDNINTLKSEIMYYL